MPSSISPYYLNPARWGRASALRGELPLGAWSPHTGVKSHPYWGVVVRSARDTSRPYLVNENTRAPRTTKVTHKMAWHKMPVWRYHVHRHQRSDPPQHYHRLLSPPPL